ncbi:MFS transporter [Natrinema gelatinilyticum]|uniref:MFS transporter n=1 Tax=Natrinema gelatinilyticum TaxID=2961571 RepID=UPI0020C26465|nr:MFS transporter [Natrinema gelatinilyticum]
MGLNKNDRAIAGFTMAGHSLVHWFETSIPIFLVVWLAEFDVSVALAGVIVALGYAPFGLGSLPGGVLVDRFGPKRLIVLCLVGMSASFLVLALSTSIHLVAVGLICWGVAASVYHPAGLALISTGVDERGTVLGWHGIAGNAGIALGPFAAATLLFLTDQWHLVAGLLAIPGFVAAAYGLRVDFDASTADGDADADENDPMSLAEFLSTSRVLFTSAFAVVFAIIAFEGLFYRGILTYLPEILHGLPAMEDVTLSAGLEGISPGDYIYVGLLVVGMAGQYAGGKLTDRIQSERGLIAIFAILCVLAVAFVPVLSMGLVPIILLCIVLGFFLFATQPLYQDAVAVHTPSSARGLSYGYTYVGKFGIGPVSIAIGGFVLGGYSTAAFFGVLAAFAFVGMALTAGLLVALNRAGWWQTTPAATNSGD